MLLNPTVIANYLSKNTVHIGCDLPSPCTDTKIIITIPCYLEPNWLHTLNSLLKCPTQHFKAEILILFNIPDNSTQADILKNATDHQRALEWAEQHATKHLKIFPLCALLPAKHAGVGLARKWLMDLAFYRFSQINCNGIIACLDADCTVSENYLEAIVHHFQYNKTPGCSIYFEHDLTAAGENQQAITEYELYLRYYVHALRWAGHPHAFQTVGSAMAVTAEAYGKQGGMNTRKAGEDFYFLQKIMYLGGFSEIKNCTVYPSARVSHRVPFGTGKAMHNFCINKVTLVPDFESFIALKSWFENIKKYGLASVNAPLPVPIENYLTEHSLHPQLLKVYQNAADYTTFMARFFNWFDLFNVLKFMHYVRDYAIAYKPVAEAVPAFLSVLCANVSNTTDIEMLQHFRSIDKHNRL